MKKLILILSCVLALSAFKEEKAQTQAKPVIRIGVTLPLTGGFAETGLSAKEAVIMAFEKWQSENTKYDYELFIEDDASQPQKAALNAQNFINTKNVSAIISLFGIVDRPIDEIANRNKVISLSCSYGKMNVPEYGANNCIQNKTVAETLIPKLRKEAIKKIALVMANTNASLTVGDYFADLLPKEGFKVVAYEKYNMDTRDMRMSILNMEAKNPDYYLTFATRPLTDIFVKQLRETTGKNNVASFGSFTEMDPSLFYLIEGLWTIDTTAGTDEFESEFTTKTNHKLKGCSANSYDNLDMLIWAFENTPVENGKPIPDNMDVVKTIKNIKNWKGATGLISFHDGVASPKAKLKMYQNGKWETIEE
ncbi:MAG: ABC transporter substrate-binding protein [Alphaproteobacteria bacterium]|nr:ABC transporter substrate-binding protein [Alphaproteobacteria bacterium]